MAVRRTCRAASRTRTTHLLLLTFGTYDPAMLEELNKSAKKVGLHVAEAKKDGLYTIRKAKNGKSVAKNIDADEVRTIVKDHKEDKSSDDKKSDKKSEKKSDKK